MKKSTVFILIAIVSLAIIGIVYYKNIPKSEVLDVNNNLNENQIINEPVNSITTPNKTQTTNSNVAAPKPYTIATVATHNSKSSCWTIINGNVYDVTSFITQHPGGEKRILSICGIDGASAFTGQHGGQSRPENTLAKFLLGPLQ